MRKHVIGFLAFTLVVGLCWGAGAQVFNENHYLVYEINNEFPVDTELNLFDQFGDYSGNFFVMDKFANPVEKEVNGVITPYYNESIHQTWWRIDNDPQPERQVSFVNQFGDQDWFLGDGRYLVLPAWKDGIPPGMNEFPEWNHYKCYDVLLGPAVDIPVVLHDQWGGFGTVVVDPVLFCNPCIKEIIGGLRFEIVDNFPHLAVYRLEPTFGVDIPAIAYDQFGVWQFAGIEAIWLVVPSDKHTVVGTESKNWGSIKSLYR